MNRHLSFILCVTGILVCLAAQTGAEPLNFQQFFPRFNGSIQDRLHGVCREQYQYYQDGFSPICEEQGRQRPSCRASRVIDCVSAELKESWKANMAAAAVLLGLLPTTLAVLGSNSREASLLALRRPILALLIASGSPGVSPVRSSEYAGWPDVLRTREDMIVLPVLSTLSTVIVSAFEYLLACVSAINVAHVTWQLCILTVNSFSPEAIFFPALWVATAILVNIGGYLSIILRIRIRTVSTDCSELVNCHLGWLAQEFAPCANHSTSRIQLRKESYYFILFAWLTSVGAIGNIILGTLALSGALYIGTIDAVVVIARFFGSAVLCRIMLNFEMAGMRTTVGVSNEIVLKDRRQATHRVPDPRTYESDDGVALVPVRGRR